MSGMEAAGGYLRYLREQQGLSRTDLVRLIKTDERQIARIEAGEIDTRGSLLMALVDAVKGSAEDIKNLLLNQDATAADGRRLAASWLSADQNQRIADLVRNPEQADAVLTAIKQLRKDLGLLD